uniref:Phosphatidylinositol-4,5-bisphosphate 4-phosphatase n=1 Tax=Scophthalmus maximus TaxID=52904 RepID=A0A8D2ZFS7_SCOMX
MADGERSPLLSEQHDGTNGFSPGGGSYGHPSKPQSLPPFPSLVAPADPPPPYSPQGSPDSGSAPVISCRVCQSAISVEGKTHQHVVKCAICNEATVNRTGEGKYFFCNTRLVLSVLTVSQTQSCPMPPQQLLFPSASKRVINLGPVHIGRDSSEPQHQPVGIRVICGHCSNTFLWTEFSDRTLARCPHCRKVSSIGRRYPRRRSLLCFLLFIALAVGTWRPAQRSKGIYVSWALLILLSLFTMVRTVYWRCLKISDPISNIT